MNPYDFVRVDWQHPGVRRRVPDQSRFNANHLSGRLEGTITTLMPLFIPGGKRTDDPKPFLRNRQGHALIPGASLKGLFRSVVETVDGGSWWFFGRDGTWSDSTVPGGQVDYSTKLPNAFKRPTNINDLDAACRMFGFLYRRDLLAGSVGFDDALCPAPTLYEPIYTCVLSSPKPRHEAWYLDPTKQYARGRKFYLHATRVQTAPHWLPRRDTPPSQRQNDHIHPIGVGSVFAFRCHFTNVAPDDFALLLYAIVLEPSMRHKLGYAKPAGLGSIAVQIQWLETVDYLARYRAGSGGITRYTDAALQAFLARTLQSYTSNTTSPTLQDLRRIWRWPPDHQLQYPSQAWFQANPQGPLSATP